MVLAPMRFSQADAGIASPHRGHGHEPALTREQQLAAIPHAHAVDGTGVEGSQALLWGALGVRAWARRQKASVHPHRVVGALAIAPVGRRLQGR